MPGTIPINTDIDNMNIVLGFIVSSRDEFSSQFREFPRPIPNFFPAIKLLMKYGRDKMVVATKQGHYQDNWGLAQPFRI